jgi:hypothetical protein
VLQQGLELRSRDVKSHHGVVELQSRFNRQLRNFTGLSINFRVGFG